MTLIIGKSTNKVKHNTSPAMLSVTYDTGQNVLPQYSSVSSRCDRKATALTLVALQYV